MLKKIDSDIVNKIGYCLCVWFTGFIYFFYADGLPKRCMLDIVFVFVPFFVLFFSPCLYLLFFLLWKKFNS